MSEAKPPEAPPDTPCEIHEALRAALDADDAGEVRRLIEVSAARVDGLESIPDRLAHRVRLHLTIGSGFTDSAAEALAYADRAAQVMERAQSPPTDRALHQLVRAYANVTATADHLAQTRAAVAAVEQWAERATDTRGPIDEQLALALHNLSVDDESLRNRKRLAAQVRRIAARQPEPVEWIDELLAGALANHGGAAKEDQQVSQEVLEEISGLRGRWMQSRAIAAAWAMTMWNAHLANPVEIEPRSMAVQLEAAAAAFSEPVQMVDRILARVLDVLGESASDLGELQAITARCEQVALRQAPPDRGIDYRWACLVVPPKPLRRDAGVMGTAMKRCKEIAGRHDPPDRGIDGKWAWVSALEAVRPDPHDAGRWERALERVDAIAARHPPTDDPEDAIERLRAECRRSVGKLRAGADWGERGRRLHADSDGGGPG